MKYFGYMLGSQRWIHSFAFLTASLGIAYWASLQVLHRQHFHYPSLGQTTNFNFYFETLLDLVFICLLFILLYERQENFKNLGLSFTKNDFFHILYLVLSIAGAYVLFALFYTFYVRVLHANVPETSESTTQIMDMVESALLQSSFPNLMLFLAANAAFEELIVRAFLMTELNAWLKNGVITVLASALLQTGYHLYQGWVRCIPIFFLFLFFSIYYQRTKRITPLIVVHFTVDLFSVSMLILYSKIYPNFPH